MAIDRSMAAIEALMAQASRRQSVKLKQLASTSAAAQQPLVDAAVRSVLEPIGFHADQLRSAIQSSNKVELHKAVLPAVYGGKVPSQAALIPYMKGRKAEATIRASDLSRRLDLSIPAVQRSLDAARKALNAGNKPLAAVHIEAAKRGYIEAWALARGVVIAKAGSPPSVWHTALTEMRATQLAPATTPRAGFKPAADGQPYAGKQRTTMTQKPYTLGPGALRGLGALSPEAQVALDNATAAVIQQIQISTDQLKYAVDQSIQKSMAEQNQQQTTSQLPKLAMPGAQGASTRLPAPLIFGAGALLALKFLL